MLDLLLTIVSIEISLHTWEMTPKSRNVGSEIEGRVYANPFEVIVEITGGCITIQSRANELNCDCGALGSVRRGCGPNRNNQHKVRHSHELVELLPTAFVGVLPRSPPPPPPSPTVSTRRRRSVAPTRSTSSPRNYIRTRRCVGIRLSR